MPSGVFQATASRSPPGAERAAASRHACSAGDSSSEGAGHRSDRGGERDRLSAAPQRQFPTMKKADSEPRRRRRPRRRHRPSRRAAGAHSRRPAPLQAPDARLADRDGAQDLGGDRPAAAGPANIVVTRDPAWQAEGAEPAASLDAALALAAASERVFVIGGAEIYALALPLGRRARADRDRRRVPRRHLLSGVGPGRFQARLQARRTQRRKACATASSAIDEPHRRNRTLSQGFHVPAAPDDHEVEQQAHAEPHAARRDAARCERAEREHGFVSNQDRGMCDR